MKIRLCAIILWMVIIFYFSAQPGGTSSIISDTVSYKIIDMADKSLNIGWNNSQKEDYAKNLHYPIRKAAHMTEYAILAVLILTYILKFKETKELAVILHEKILYIISQVITVIYAVSDEFHQLFVEERSCQITDVLIDSIGGMIGILMVYLYKSKNRR